MEKKSFILYGDYREHFALLSREEQGELIMAIFAYEEEGEVQELSPASAMAFSFIRRQLDRDEEKYRETCEKRKEAGKRSGEVRSSRKEQSRTKGTNANFVEQEGTKGTENDTVTDTENETGNDIETVTDTENDTVTETGNDSFTLSIPPTPQRGSEERRDKREQRREKEGMASHPDMNSSPFTLSSPPKSPQRGEGRGGQKNIPRGFEVFWQVYPRKEAKAEALKLWRELNPSLELETDIIAHVQKRCQSWDWQKDGGQFVPYASTFLRQHRWEDDFSMDMPVATHSPGGKEVCTFADLYREQYGEVSCL